jgi:prolipoprotein diacylglyceryltransferase
VNFGDNVPRHPTQLYESAFMLLMFVYMEKVKNRADLAPGRLFDVLMTSYFTFRFFIEFIRVEKTAFWGLTVFQLISLAVIIYLNRELLLNSVRKQKAYA